MFISYRRDDTDGHAGRLYDSLVARLGEANVFMDIDSIEPGQDFVDVLEEKVANCDVVLALIGRDWITATDDKGRRRLDNPRDWVRLEIQAALDGTARVIPVLVRGAEMPQGTELPRRLAPLARRNAFVIGPRWHSDVGRLIDAIEGSKEPLLAPPTRSSTPGTSTSVAGAGTDGRRPPFDASAPIEVWAGSPSPLGAAPDGEGTNFAIYSETADRVELCLFGGDGREVRVPLPEVDGSVWHGYVPGANVGLRYGYRVHGSYDPARGLLHNPAKLLVDPYTRAIAGDVNWRDDAIFGSVDGNRPNPRDSAPHMPKSVVIEPTFAWGDDRPPRTPWSESVIYETHVRGFTARHPGVPRHLRGTYAGMASEAAVEHLVETGITAVELQPVHHFASDRALVQRGLANYWGYNTLGFFAPHGGYSSAGSDGEQVREFKEMVRVLHAAGIEVILDVVYGHTVEGNHLGPTLSFRGIDNATYYRLVADDPRHYVDYTGCGNTLNTRHRTVLALIMDSLRYWVNEMHVDGFRFDQGSVLARGLHEVDRLSAFFDLIHQDPVISSVKLIAEPWDVGEGGYQVGNFPALWTEWNGRYRDAVRDFWRGEQGANAEVAARLTGSTDLYEADGRRPSASINFLTAHDGFTLHDLVTYTRKRNEANGEDNRDGVDDNRSWNCGIEGETDDPAVVSLRRRQQRNFLASLLLSQGVPMILGGDELDRTQYGNNNAYCQDNEVSWYDWELGTDAQALLEFTRRVIALRREHPVFRRSRFFQGRPMSGSGTADVAWFGPDGNEITEAEWTTTAFSALGMFLNGDALGSAGPRGERMVDDTFLVILNAGEPARFQLPDMRWAWSYDVVLDTTLDRGFVPDDESVVEAGQALDIPGRSVLLLRKHT